MKILIIDDEQGILDVVSRSLGRLGYECTNFSDPVKAVDAYKAEDFNIVITDIRMPEMSGIDVLKAIKKQNPAAYVLLLTGYADVDNAIDAVNSGAYAFLRKPLEIKELVDTIKSVEEELNKV